MTSLSSNYKVIWQFEKERGHWRWNQSNGDQFESLFGLTPTQTWPCRLLNPEEDVQVMDRWEDLSSPSISSDSKMPHSLHLSIVFLLLCLLTSSFAQNEDKEDQEDRNTALRPSLIDVMGQLFAIVFILPFGLTLLYFYTIIHFLSTLVPRFFGFM